MNLFEVKFMDSSGLSLLVLAQRMADAAGARLTLRAFERVRTLLRITAMTDLFDFEKDPAP